VNYWAILNPGGVTLWSEYHPPKGDQLCTREIQRGPTPFFPPPYIQGMLGNGSNWEEGWLSVFKPNATEEPMLITFDAIMVPDKDGKMTNPKQYGFLMAARVIQPRTALYAADTPGCISIVSKANDSNDYFDDLDREMWEKGEAGSFTGRITFGGVPTFTTRDKNYLQKCEIRKCPNVPLFNDTDKMMTGYFTLCGIDPKVNNRTTCINMRMDRPMSRVDQGTVPVVWLSVEIVGILIILCTIFVIFLDCAVLRRVDKLSNVIREQTRSHQEAIDAVEKGETTPGVYGEKGEKGPGKKGKSSRSTADFSRTNTSSDGDDAGGARTRDEIGNLKRAMERNARGLRKRLEGVNDSLKLEQQKALYHRQAMELLNIWCGRVEFFPGLRPNAMQLRYEPPRSLDDLLTSPIAIEYLKSHCDNESTLENLWFLLDVSWLQELETAEDDEEDPEKRKLVHDVCKETSTMILSRYIAADAPQQINVSSATFQSLRDKGSVYERGMFEEAVKEVKLMLNTDVLPRFQKSPAYPAMSETLFINNSGDGDDSEFSDATVSTAGSILIDSVGEVEVGPVFAHTFKNLNTDFDMGGDGSSTTASSHGTAGTPRGTGPSSASLVAGTLTTTTTTTETGKQADTSTKDGSSVTGSEIHAEKKVQPDQEVEPKKKESDSSNSDSSSDSSDSSSNSFSSGSMTMSDESSD